MDMKRGTKNEDPATAASEATTTNLKEPTTLKDFFSTP